MYAIVLLLAVSSKNLSRLIPIVLLGVGGRMIWIYLFFAGRYPERVTMSLYIMEILLLMGIIIRQINNDGMVQKTTIIQKAAIIGVGVAFILGSVQSVSSSFTFTCSTTDGKHFGVKTTRPLSSTLIS